MSGLNKGDTVTFKKITSQPQFAAEFTGKVKSITKKMSSDGHIEEIVVEDNNGKVTLIYSVDEKDYYAVNSTIPKISAPNEYTLVKKSKSGGKKRKKTRKPGFSKKRRRGGRKTVKKRGGKRKSRVTRRGGKHRSRIRKGGAFFGLTWDEFKNYDPWSRFGA